jgi:hypothetical protein
MVEYTHLFEGGRRVEQAPQRTGRHGGPHKRGDGDHGLKKLALPRPCVEHGSVEVEGSSVFRCEGQAGTG